jgi:putative flippase GtrA
MSTDIAARSNSTFCKFEVVRYVLNGIIATLVHFAVLTFNMQVFDMRSAAVGNGVASIFGIAVSFIGSRFYVFRRRNASIITQAAKFLALYSSIACLHISILFLWTDFFNRSYQIGFVIATILQIAASFIGNKLLVFK